MNVNAPVVGALATNNNLNGTALDQFYTDLSSTAATGTTATPTQYGVIDVSGNPGIATDTPTIATAKGYVILGT